MVVERNVLSLAVETKTFCDSFFFFQILFFFFGNGRLATARFFSSSFENLCTSDTPFLTQKPKKSNTKRQSVDLPLGSTLATNVINEIDAHETLFSCHSKERIAGT